MFRHSAALLLFAIAASAAVNIDALGRECQVARQQSCDQLVSLARTSRDAGSRRKSAEWLIKARSRDCASQSAGSQKLPAGQSVRLTSQYFFESALDPAREDQIVKAGDSAVADAVRALGLNVSSGQAAAQPEIELTVFGAARAWLFGRSEGDVNLQPDALAVVLYPDVIWKGVITVRAAGKCLCAETIRTGVPPHHDIEYGPPRKKESDAPFRRDLRNALAPAMINLGKDLYGPAALSSLLRGTGWIRIREIALAQVRDQSVLAAVARGDSEEHLRWAAVNKLGDQAALAQVAQTDASRYVRLLAVQKLLDPRVLSAIASSDADREIRTRARARMDKLR